MRNEASIVKNTKGGGFILFGLNGSKNMSKKGSLVQNQRALAIVAPLCIYCLLSTRRLGRAAKEKLCQIWNTWDANERELLTRIKRNKYFKESKFEIRLTTFLYRDRLKYGYLQKKSGVVQ